MYEIRGWSQCIAQLWISRYLWCAVITPVIPLAASQEVRGRTWGYRERTWHSKSPWGCPALEKGGEVELAHGDRRLSTISGIKGVADTACLYNFPGRFFSENISKETC